MTETIVAPTLLLTLSWHFAANRPLGRGVQMTYKIQRAFSSFEGHGTLCLSDRSRWHWNDKIPDAYQKFMAERCRLAGLSWTVISHATPKKLVAAKQGFCALDCVEWGRNLDLDPQLLFDAFLKENQ